MLEGKAKEMFDKWMRPNPLEHGRFGQLVTNTFDNMNSSLQWGVIQDWADSIGYFFEIVYFSKDAWVCRIFTKEKDYSLGVSISRQECRNRGITKLSELVNNKYK